MSAISAVSSVMTQVMMLRLPSGPPPPPPPATTGGTDGDGDSDADATASDAPSSGRLLDISV
jgi:hypothetical protein